MKHQLLVFTLGIAGVRESVGTRVVGMRSLISCMTRNIPYRICIIYMECDWTISWFPLHVHFRWGVALIGEIFYWALLTLLWDSLSGTRSVQEDDAPTRP